VRNAKIRIRTLKNTTGLALKNSPKPLFSKEKPLKSPESRQNPDNLSPQTLKTAENHVNRRCDKLAQAANKPVWNFQFDDNQSDPPSYQLAPKFDPDVSI